MTPRYIDIHTHHPHPEVCSPTMAGIHPWDAERRLPLPDFTAADIIGETGLDYACDTSRERQELLFAEHLDAAEQLAKPVVLHVVRSFERVMQMLDRYTLRGVLFHGFVGSVEQAERCAKHGYYLSFGASSLRSPRTRMVIATYPVELLFCETDDCTTPDIEQIYAEVAALRNTTVEELLKHLTTNYNRLILNK